MSYHHLLEMLQCLPTIKIKTSNMDDNVSQDLVLTISYTQSPDLCTTVSLIFPIFSYTAKPSTQAVVSLWVTHYPPTSEMVWTSSLSLVLSSDVAFSETISLTAIICSLTRSLQFLLLITVAILHLLVELFDQFLSSLQAIPLSVQLCILSTMLSP